MAANLAVLEPVTQRGWRAGLANLVRKEANTWLRTRNGLITDRMLGGLDYSSGIRCRRRLHGRVLGRPGAIADGAGP